jgi:dienelactone hydrolase
VRRRRSTLLAAILLGAAPAAAIGSACSTPSSEIDGGDLMGVFSHDAGSDAAVDAGRSRKHKDGGADASAPAPAASAAADASVRAPVPGVCVAEEGTPDKDLRRVLGRPPCRGAQVMEGKDAEGSPRYACVVAPPGVETRAPLPLVIFFHDPQDDPSAVHKKTNLPKLSATFDLTGDPAHTGFVVLAPQGRAIRHGKIGAAFDTDYTGPDNVDVATVDHFVEELDKKGLVDHRRVYALGASYGGHMAATYAMMRADKVAAFAAFAADAPHASWSCPGPPPPGLVLYRACDGFFSCESVERWLRARDAVSAETAWIRLGAGNDEEPSCAIRNKCSHERSESNHHRWPKGREGDILRFFARHALGSAPGPGAEGGSSARSPGR